MSAKTVKESLDQDRISNVSNWTEQEECCTSNAAADPLHDLHLDLLDELDDVEFEIPQVDEVPTLESILSEAEDLNAITEEDLNVNLIVAMQNSEFGSSCTIPESINGSNPFAIDFQERASISSFDSRICGSLPADVTAQSTGLAALRNSRLSLVSDSASPVHARSDTDQDKGSGPEKRKDNDKGTRSQSPSHHRTEVHLSSTGVLKCAQLRRLSAQLRSTNQKIHCGTHTAIAVQNSYLAVGTSNGLVMVFDQSQTMKYLLGQSDDPALKPSSPVSAISINSDESRLLAGYSNGEVRLFNLLNGNLIQFSKSDCHSPETSVTHVKFTTDMRVAILADSGGSIFELKFNRARTKFKSEIIFSGSRGEVLAIEPLSIPSEITDSLGTTGGIILAMATVTKLIVISLLPTTTVLFTLPLREPPQFLPILSWQFVLIQTQPHRRGFDPVLAVARNRTIQFFQMDTNASSSSVTQPIFNLLQKFELSYSVLSFNWFNSRTLLVLDTQENIHVVDIRSEQELETISIAHIGIARGKDHFLGTFITGGPGPVSRAMATASDNAVYYSTVMCNISASSATASQYLVLGADSAIHMYTLKTWTERIDSLIREELLNEAMSLTLDFYSDRAKAVVGLRSSQKRENREKIADKMLQVLLNFMDFAEQKLCPSSGSITDLVAHYSHIIQTVVKYSLSVKRPSFVLDEVKERYAMEHTAIGVFYEALEPHIIDGTLTNLGPALTQELIEYYADYNQYYERLEKILVNLDISSLDIDRVIKLCRHNGLYDGIFFIHNEAFKDYVTPLEELLVRLADIYDIDHRDTERQNPIPDEVARLGNKLLVYINCCLSGLAYPSGILASDLQAQVRKDVLNTLLKLKGSPPLAPLGVYPYLKLLLHFDAHEFLNVLSIAFDDSALESSSRSTQGNRDSVTALDIRQKIVDILLMLMVDGQANNFRQEDVSALFIFIARQLSKSNECPILINKALVDQVVDQLTSPQNSSRFEERQQALVELFRVENFVIEFNWPEIYEKALHSKFYRICELINLREREFDKMLTCYLDDATNSQMETFDFIRRTLSDVTVTEAEKTRFTKALFSNLWKLVDFDPERTAMTLLLHTRNSNALRNQIEILSKTHPKLEFDLLDAMIQLKHGFVPHLPLLEADDPYMSDLNFVSKSEIFSGHELLERHLDLLFRFEPQSVFQHLKQSDLKCFSSLERLLDLCRRHDAADATALILCRMDRHQEAFTVMYSRLEESLRNLKNSETEDCELLFSQCLSRLIDISGYSQQAGNSDSANMYLSILELFMSELQGIHSESEADQTAMSSSVAYKANIKKAISVTLDRFVSHGACNASDAIATLVAKFDSDQFPELKNLIMELLVTCEDEKSILSATSNIVHSDLADLVVRSVSKRNSAIPVRHPTLCTLCETPIKRGHSSRNDSQMLLFNCSHAYHMDCIPVSSGNTSTARSCVKCDFLESVTRPTSTSASSFS